MSVFAQATKDVLDIDDRIVDQFADRNGQSTKRHRVDRHAQPFENQRGDQNRKGDRCQRDERRTQIQQEEKQNHHDEQAAVAQRMNYVLDPQLNKTLLLKDVGLDANVRRQRRAQIFDGRFYMVGQQSGVSSRLLRYDEDYRGPPVDR